MLKLIGAVLILCSGTLVGFYQAQQLAGRPKQIRRLILALQRLETEIAYGFTHLPDALAKIASQTASPLAQLFRQMAEQLENAGGSAKDIWHTAVEDGWKHTAMKNSEKEIVLQLGLTLGMTDREDQVKHLRLCINQLQTEESSAREEQQRYEKMWKSLGILAGALVVILIY